MKKFMQPATQEANNYKFHLGRGLAGVDFLAAIGSSDIGELSQGAFDNSALGKRNKPTRCVSFGGTLSSAEYYLRVSYELDGLATIGAGSLEMLDNAE